MQTQVKQVAIDTRQMTLGMLALAGRALAAGLVVSVGISVLIVAAVILAG